MPNITPNYGLFKPTGNENVDISILNDNMDILDEALFNKPDAEDIPTKLSELAEDENHRLATDDEKEKWNGKATTATYSGTLGTSWTDASGYFTQEVTVTGILATDTPVIDIVCSTDGFEEEQEAWGKVFKAVTSANKITFYASEATTKSVSFTAKVVR